MGPAHRSGRMGARRPRRQEKPRYTRPETRPGYSGMLLEHQGFVLSKTAK